MAHIRKIETNQRRNGKPVAHYEVRWTETVVTADGRRRKKYKQETFPTKDAADDRLREIESERAATGAVTGREARLEPFAAFAYAWLDSLSGTVKARTLAEYRRLYETYVAPEFATRPVGGITPAMARAFRADLVGRGLARGTIKHAFDVFRRTLDLAVQDGAIPSNPAVSVPRLRTGDVEPFAPHPLTSDQVGAVAAHIEKTYPVYGLAVLFLAATGLRAAELAGLEVADLDLTKRTIRVTRTKRKVRGGWETGTPKSRKSRRVVPLDGWLVDDLRAYLATHPRRDDPSAPLFPARYGRNAPVPREEAANTYNWAVPVEPGTFYANYLKPALTAVGLPASAPGVRGVRLHDLRHTFAVLSLSAGAHYMQVSKWLGHESYVTTLTIYADYIDESEGGKATPLARPTAPSPAPDRGANVINLADRRRNAG
ncbi:tyrosine-type recombinase/integrase [Pseudonocardia cypriaca]|uniref:Site-specific recombinase XerC n=1 Tax=Pseudonocardia cypriaca TaxID=882449 RepID=A0A543GDH1_9PSEU|nr:tyrosine-type recombinase/integrase [Pseudonocardia cypriaca]TQM44106.1 site-specific recombinase XerC [Pseudonocardia cypriaca]